MIVRAARRAPRGLSLLELMVVLGLLTAFLALAYQPLESLILYPRRSEQAFSDRATAVHVEGDLTDNLAWTEAGYLWTVTTEKSVDVLMGQAREYRSPKESPITGYTLYHYDAATCMLEKWQLAPDVVKDLMGERLRPGTELTEAQMARLMTVRGGRSVVATRVTRFLLGLSDGGRLCTFEVWVSTVNSKLPEAQRTGPSKVVQRTVGVVGQDGE